MMVKNLKHIKSFNESSKKFRKKLKPKIPQEKYLNAYVSWGWALSSFKIVNGDTYETITERDLRKNGKQCWFNLTNIKKEVEDYAKKHNLKTDLGELYFSLDKQGLSYSHLEPHLDEIKKIAKERSITLID